MNRRAHPHDGWEIPYRERPSLLAWFVCTIIAALVLGAALALWGLVVSSARENAPPTPEAGGALPSSSQPTTEGTAS